MANRLRVTFYLASAIEHADPTTAHEWKVRIKEELGKPDIGIYDPVEQEAFKTGKSSRETVDYVTNLKRAGHWRLFHGEMHKIWWGEVGETCDKLRLLQLFRDRAVIDGNQREEFMAWGDSEAVVRSTFIFAYLAKNVRTVGAIREIHLAYLLNVPVFLIIPDQTKTEANSTLLDMVVKSGGAVFYSVDEAIKFVKDKYGI
jgi:hypothetical protein